MEFCFAKSTTDVVFKSLSFQKYVIPKVSIFVGTIGFLNVTIFSGLSYIDLNDSVICPPSTWILREM